MLPPEGFQEEEKGWYISAENQSDYSKLFRNVDRKTSGCR